MRQFPLAHKFSVADNNRQNTGGKGAVSILLGIADQPDSFAVDGKIRIFQGGKNRVGRRFVARSIAITEDCIKNNIRKKCRTSAVNSVFSLLETTYMPTPAFMQLRRKSAAPGAGTIRRIPCTR